MTYFNTMPARPILPTRTYLRFFLLPLFIALAPRSAFAETDTSAALANIRYKLAVEKKLTVGYFGASITQGAGASNTGVTCWRALTSTWLKQRFPQAVITEIDASIGGTLSDLGSFRCERDLTSKNPDLVFIEFSVNDWQKTSDYIQPYSEGIVRHTLRKNPNAGIIYIHAVHDNSIANYDAGRNPPAVDAHQAVADYYGAPGINVGKKLWSEIKAGRGTLATLTTDGTHPNDAGYKIYADEVAGVLQRHLVTPPAPAAYAPKSLPASMMANPIEYGQVVDGTAVTATGWSSNIQTGARFPNGITSNVPGSVLRYNFQGTAIAVYWETAPDGGDIEWSVDGSTPVKVTAYATAQRGWFSLFTRNLAAGNHQLTVTVLSTKNAASSGYRIRIDAFLVNGLAPVPILNAPNTRFSSPRQTFGRHGRYQGDFKTPGSIGKTVLGRRI